MPAGFSSILEASYNGDAYRSMEMGEIIGVNFLSATHKPKLHAAESKSLHQRPSGQGWIVKNVVRQAPHMFCRLPEKCSALLPCLLLFAADESSEEHSLFQHLDRTEVMYCMRAVAFDSCDSYVMLSYPAGSFSKEAHR